MNGHQSIDCYHRVKCKENGCEKFHHTSLQDAHAKGVTFHASSDVHNSVLLQLLRVPTSSSPSQDLNVVGQRANIGLITFERASELGLQGESTRLSVTIVGDEERVIDSKKYTLPLRDKCGRTVEFVLYGIDVISNDIRKLNLDKVLSLFSQFIDEENELLRPTGKVDVLIGYSCAHFHPSRIHLVGHLLLLSNQFGKCLGGSHPSLVDRSRKVINNVAVHHARGGGGGGQKLKISITWKIWL